VWRDINTDMKIYAEFPETLLHKVYEIKNLHRKVHKCLSYCQSSHHFQMKCRHKGTLVYAHKIENPEKVARI
jgi:hypothetical protein